MLQRQQCRRREGSQEAGMSSHAASVGRIRLVTSCTSGWSVLRFAQCIVSAAENPMAEEDDYRLEVLIALRKIERLDKDEFSEEERGEAQEIYEQRRQEELEAEALAVRRQRDVIDRAE